jgi:hypothetical protein
MARLSLRAEQGQQLAMAATAISEKNSLSNELKGFDCRWLEELKCQKQKKVTQCVLLE